MQYRPEIEGLRGIAVIAVILFHAGLPFFGGGFVGVDVFFVISGYLITLVLIPEGENRSFSLSSFYERRARRVLPALFLVLATCLPFAFLWLLPNYQKDFFKSLIGTVGFVSNILLWRDSGYFDTTAGLKPLLHTWSLSIEVQFYLLFPLFILLIRRLGKRSVGVLLTLGLLSSFFLAQWSSKTWPAATFFLLPTRVWQLLLGATVAVYSKAGWTRGAGRGWSELVGLIGLLLISYAILFFNEQTTSPGVSNLIPTIGAALIVLFVSSGTFLGKLLGSAPLVSLGLVSYSAYLWHQPLFAFLRHRSIDGLSTSLALCLVLVTFALSFLSWRYVEEPFRARNRLSKLAVLVFGVSGVVFFMGAGYFGLWYSTEQFRISSEWKKGIRNQKVMLLGDSHAGQFAEGLQPVLGDSLVVRSFSGCIPFYNVDRYDARFVPGECVKQVNKALLEFESSADISLLILSTMGPVYLDGTPFRGKDVARVTGLGVELVDDKSNKDRWAVFEIGMRRTLKRFESLQDKQVLFVLDPPELGIEPGQCGVHKAVLTVLGTKFGRGEVNFDDCRISRLEFNNRAQLYHERVKSILRDFPSVALFDPTSLFCDDDWCYGAKQNKRLYYDVDHLSPFGSFYVAKWLAPVVGELLAAKPH